jgi:anti-sigma factor RsiW
LNTIRPRASTAHPAESDLKHYADSVDVPDRSAIREHLRSCARCSRIVANHRVGARRVREGLPATSARLHRTLIEGVRRAARDHPLVAPESAPRGPSLTPPGRGRWLRTGGKLLLAGVVIYAGLELRSRSRREKALQG